MRCGGRRSRIRHAVAGPVPPGHRPRGPAPASPASPPGGLASQHGAGSGPAAQADDPVRGRRAAGLVRLAGSAGTARAGRRAVVAPTGSVDAEIVGLAELATDAAVLDVALEVHARAAAER